MASSPKSTERQRNGSARAATESFERCDTDGFLSQWASGLTADLPARRPEPPPNRRHHPNKINNGPVWIED